MRVEEEVDKADVANSVIVAIGGRKLPVDYDLFENSRGQTPKIRGIRGKIRGDRP